MKILVTGGSGFIGSHVVDKLIEFGHDVSVMDYGVKPHLSDIEYLNVDIIDFSSVLNATKGFDYIFHLAAMSNVNQVFDKPVYSVQLNTVGTINLLEASRLNNIKRFIFASTVWVYSGCKDHEVTEETPFYMPGPGHIYTSTKIASEFYIHDYNNLYDLPYTILRYGIPYGPRMRKKLLIPIFIEKGFSGKPLTIAGDGNQYRNFLYVEDLAIAHILALSNKAENQIINLEGMRKITIYEVAETIKKLIDDSLLITSIPDRPGDYKGKLISNQKAKEILDWEPEIDFESGMKKTIEWYKHKYNFTK